MIERIAESQAGMIAMASSGQSLAKRRRRLKWLATLREASPGLVAIEAGEVVAPPPADPRARISDALSTLQELRGDEDDAGDDLPRDVSGGATITASELAGRIVRMGRRSLGVQAHLGAATVRQLVGAVR